MAELPPKGPPHAAGSPHSLSKNERPISPGLREIVVDWLREEALLIDVDRLLALATQLRDVGHEPVQAVRQAAARILHADKSLALADQGEGLDDEECYAFFAEVLLLPPGRGPWTAWRFNRLPQTVRRASLGLFFRGLSIEECVEQGLAESEDDLIRLARQGMLTLLAVDEDQLRQNAEKGTNS